MKKGLFSALLCREFITARQTMISYVIMSLIMLPMPFLVLLSFTHGNLGLFIPEDMHWIFLGEDGIMLKLFVLAGVAMLAMGSSDSMGCEVSLKWDRFRRSTPVKPARMALAKVTIQAVFTVIAAVMSLVMIWLLDLALGVPFSAADAAMALLLVAAVTLFSQLALLSVLLFRSVDKGMLALLGCIMAVVFVITMFNKDSTPAAYAEKKEQAMQTMDKIMDFCTDLLPFLPFILIGTLALGFVGLTLLYKRRER